MTTLVHTVPDEHLNLIGAIVVSWTHLENLYEDAVWGFSGLNVVAGLAITTHMRMLSRIEALTTYINEIYPKSDLADDLAELVSRTGKARVKRNNIVHATWNETGTYKYTARGAIKPNEKTYDTEYMTELLIEINQLHSDVFYFLRANNLLPERALPYTPETR